MALFVAFVILPFIQGLPYSFWKWDGFSQKHEWVGLKNYLRIFLDKSILQPTGNTLAFSALTVLFCNLFGLLIALAIQRTTVFNSAIRTIFFMPYVISVVLAAYIWSFIYSDVFYSLLGIRSPLGNAQNVIPGLAVIAIWKDSGYCMIIYLAALNLVPQAYYEAATMDGCGKVKQFFKITLPMIMPAFTANTTLILSWGLKVFEYPMVATGGGPGQASESIAMCIYRNIFEYYKAGYGQAIAVVFTILLGILTGAVSAILRRREVEI